MIFEKKYNYLKHRGSIRGSSPKKKILIYSAGAQFFPHANENHEKIPGGGAFTIRKFVSSG